MRGRRLVFLAVLLIVALVTINALWSSDTSFDDGNGAAPATGAKPAPVVEASLPANRDVRARVGEVVRLRVRAPSSDVVQVPSLAVEQPVDPGVPADIVFVANRAGRFPIRLRDAGEAVGTLRVSQ